MPAESAKGLRTKGKVPIAKPPKPDVQLEVAEEEDVEQPFWSVETLKGFGTSIALHGLLLLVLAFWYFAPRVNHAQVFDTRMAGSDMGVADGLSLTGGLNSEIEMPQGTPELSPAPTVATLNAPVELKAPELKTKDTFGQNQRSVGGGMKNNNPGAGNGDGFGLARFGSGGENIHGVEVKVGDPQFTLIWDNDVDLDLHVIEPSGKEIYWEDPKGTPGLGGELDVDNTKGFGPENVYWLRPDETGNKEIPGPGPSGVYKWFVVYWGGFGGIPKPTHWKVRVKHDGKVDMYTGRFKALNERSKVYTLTVEPSENRPKASKETAEKGQDKDKGKE
ncbi:MAG: hypothetical protein P4L84_36975 [Isosphaeraceae bacterium]|nr:hypothetical protein [Isosphaeraceae bacterium]